MPVPPLPLLYARALRWRVYALSLWLGRMALAPLGLARYTESLLVVPVAVGLIGGFMGPWALWRRDRPAALAELMAACLALVPTVGWMWSSYGPIPLSDATLPVGTGPGWLSAAGAAWLLALAFVGHRLDALRPAAWLPAGLLLVIDLPPLHHHVFVLSPRLADVPAPLATVLAIFALARMEKSGRVGGARSADARRIGI